MNTAEKQARIALAHAEDKLAKAQDALDRLLAREDTRTPVRGYEAPNLSGRHPSDRTIARIAKAQRQVNACARRVELHKRRVQETKRNASAIVDLDNLAPGWFVRDNIGWHRVKRVNAKTVTTDGDFGYRIAKGKILETRCAMPAPDAH